MILNGEITRMLAEFSGSKEKCNNNPVVTLVLVDVIYGKRRYPSLLYPQSGPCSTILAEQTLDGSPYHLLSGPCPALMGRSLWHAHTQPGYSSLSSQKAGKKEIEKRHMWMRRRSVPYILKTSSLHTVVGAVALRLLPSCLTDLLVPSQENECLSLLLP